MLVALVLGCVPAATTAEPADAQQPASSDKKIKAVCILWVPDGPAWGPTKNGFLRRCEELGWEAEFMAPITPNSEPGMIELAENAVSTGCDVLITHADHGDMWADVLLRAQEKGITTIAVCAPPNTLNLSGGLTNEDLINGYVGFDAEAVIRLQAQTMDKIIPKDVQINAMMIHATLNDKITRYYEALQDELTKLRPNSTFVGLESDDSNAAKAADLIASYKIAHPELNCVFGMSAATATGAHSYIAENNLQGKLYVIGVDAAPESLATVKAGTVSCIIDQGYAHFGDTAVDLAAKHLAGEPFEFANMGEMSVITAENVDQWAADNNIGEIPEL